MRLRTFIFITFILSVFSFPKNSHAQLNFSTGYYGGFERPSALNEILSLHNAMHGNYIDGFKSINYIQGIHLAFRYKFGNTGLEAGVMYIPKRRVADGSNFRNTLNFSYSGPNLELQQYIGPIVLATSLDYITLKTKFQFEEPQISAKYSEGIFSSQFSIGFYHPGDEGFSWMLRPFYRIGWSDYPLDEIAEKLLGESSGNRVQSLGHFGISLHFYNGPAR